MSDKKTLHTPQREVPQNTKSTVVRLFSQLRGQRARLTVVGLSIVIYVILSIWNPLYSAVVIDHLWQSIQTAWNTGTAFVITWDNLGKELFRLTIQYLFTWVFYYLQSYLMASVAETLVLSLRTQVLLQRTPHPDFPGVHGHLRGNHQGGSL